MAFGQQSGPPATHRQIQRLLELLHNDGHTDFRDARGPMGFTQRQAGGKFTRDEADGFIEQLERAEYERDTGQSPSETPPTTTPVAPVARRTKAERVLADIPSEQLAAELQRRGWIVAEP